MELAFFVKFDRKGRFSLPDPRASQEFKFRVVEPRGYVGLHLISWCSAFLWLLDSFVFFFSSAWAYCQILFWHFLLKKSKRVQKKRVVLTHFTHTDTWVSQHNVFQTWLGVRGINPAEFICLSNHNYVKKTTNRYQQTVWWVRQSITSNVSWFSHFQNSFRHFLNDDFLPVSALPDFVFFCFPSSAMTV